MNKRFSFSRRSKWLAMLIAGLLALGIVGVALAASIAIDTFDSSDNGGLNPFYIEIRSSPAGAHTGSIHDVDSSALGGGREGVMQWVSGTGRGYFMVDDLDSNRLAFSTGDGVAATAIIRWDGASGTATVNDCGLPVTNLYSSNPSNDGFHLEIINDDLVTAATFRVYSGSTCADWSQATANLPGNIISPAHVDYFVPFASFTSGGGNGVDFSAVRAIEVFIDGTVVAGTDVSIDFLDVDWYREYGDLPTNGDLIFGPGDYSVNVLNAFQVPQGLRLGHNVDVENTSQPDVNAGTATSGDDRTNLVGEVDDEDGIQRPDITKWTPGGTAGLNVEVHGCTLANCYLNGWIDFNDNGSLSDPGEQVYSDVSVIDGTALRSFSVPASVPGFPGTLYARFRICETTTTCNAPDATNVRNGEIEDYVWNFGPTAVTLNSLQAQPVNTSPVLPVALVGGAAAILIGAVLFTRKSRKQSV